jgi:hypothetical protein
VTRTRTRKELSCPSWGHQKVKQGRTPPAAVASQIFSIPPNICTTSVVAPVEVPYGVVVSSSLSSLAHTLTHTLSLSLSRFPSLTQAPTRALSLYCSLPKNTLSSPLHLRPSSHFKFWRCLFGCCILEIAELERTHFERLPVCFLQFGNTSS